MPRARRSTDARFRLLDLYCGSGGAAMGYARAGFEVVGVDINPQPSYPFEFHQAAALDYLRDHGREFDAAHASPPCQGYTRLRTLHRTKYPLLIPKTRTLLCGAGLPFIIENVVGAPLIHPILLCGTTFGLGVFRHRLFECNFPLQGPRHESHHGGTGSHRLRRTRERGYHDQGHLYVTVCGHQFCRERGAAALGIHWMQTRAELAQAIPPAYTEYIGRRLRARLARWAII